MENKSRLLDSLLLCNLRMKCSDSIVSPGASLSVKFQYDEKIPKDFGVKIVLVADYKDSIITLLIENYDNEINILIPNDIDEGDYELQLVYQDWIIDSMPITIIAGHLLKNFGLISEGFGKHNTAMKAIDEADYELSIELSKEADHLFNESNNQEIAAFSWKEVGYKFLSNKRMDKAQIAFTKAYMIYNKIDDIKQSSSLLINLNQILFYNNLVYRLCSVLRNYAFQKSQAQNLILREQIEAISGFNRPVELKAQDVFHFISKMPVFELVNLFAMCKVELGIKDADVISDKEIEPPSIGDRKAPLEDKTKYDVILTAHGKKKIQVIKEVRAITGLGLKDAKQIIDTLPKNIKEGVSRKQAEKIKTLLEKSGAKVMFKK